MKNGRRIADHFIVKRLFEVNTSSVYAPALQDCGGCQGSAQSILRGNPKVRKDGDGYTEHFHTKI